MDLIPSILTDACQVKHNIVLNYLMPQLTWVIHWHFVKNMRVSLQNRRLPFVIHAQELIIAQESNRPSLLRNMTNIQHYRITRVGSIMHDIIMWFIETQSWTGVADHEWPANRLTFLIWISLTFNSSLENLQEYFAIRHYTCNLAYIRFLSMWQSNESMLYISMTAEGWLMPAAFTQCIFKQEHCS